MKRIGIGLLLWLGLVSGALAQALYNPSSGGSPGGSNTQVQYNTAGSFGGITGATSNGTTLTLVAPILGVATGTSLALTDAANPSASTLSLTGASALTTNQPLINGTQTWNAGAITFTAFKINVTATASAAASLLLDLQVASASKFNVDKLGNVNFASGAQLSLPGSGYILTTGTFGAIVQNAGSTLTTRLYADAFRLSANSFLAWTSTNDAGTGNEDVVLRRDAANTLALRNGATGQTFRIYSTFTDASNFQRGIFDAGSHASNYLTIAGENGGTGAAVGLQFAITKTTGGSLTDIFYIDRVAGQLAWNTDNTYDIGASGVARPRTVYAATSFDVASNGAFQVNGRSRLTTTVDGVWVVTNAAATGFTSLQFGGTTSSFPALKRSSATLIARLADDSADATFQSGQLIVSAIATDTAHTDATVCEDTTTHQFYSGSGTLGICLGTSSLRFKDHIAPLQPGLAQIVDLRPITYHYKPGYGDSSRKLYGFAAEQVNEILPELVSLDTAGRPNSIDWAGLVPVLVNAIQEQQREINALRRAIK